MIMLLPTCALGFKKVAHASAMPAANGVTLHHKEEPADSQL